MKFKQIKISDIEENVGQIEGLPKNPRKIEESELEELAVSIKELPLLLEARPVIVFPFNNKFVAIAGNQRTKSAKNKLGWETINCAVLPADTPVKTLREIAIKDNNSWGSYDFEALEKEWDLVELEEWNTDLPEFDNTEENDLDYSDKNKEIDTEDFSDKMILKLEYSSEEFLKVKQALGNEGITPEAALYKYLFPNEQLSF